MAVLTFDSLDIYEYVKVYEAEALVDLVAKIKNPGMAIAEVGSWKGFTTAYLANAVKDCGGKVYAVDHWKGNKETRQEEIAKTEDIYALFEANLKKLGLWHIVTPLREESSVASQRFEDGSLDFVFLDADHRYKEFSLDLDSWFPKLRKGGIMAGHDCERMYSGLSDDSKRIVKENLDKDTTQNGWHCGIILALKEHFDDYEIMPNSTIWYTCSEPNGTTTA